MYLKNKEVGRGRAFLIGGTIRKEMDGKKGKHVQGPVSSLVLFKFKKSDQWVSGWQHRLATLNNRGCRGSFKLQVSATSLGTKEENGVSDQQRNKGVA